MEKKTKENLKELLSNMDEYKDYRKSDIGRKSIIFLIIGLIAGIGGIFWFFYVLENNVTGDTFSLLSLIFLISFLGAYFGGIYQGQMRYYKLTQKDKQNVKK